MRRTRIGALLGLAAALAATAPVAAATWSREVAVSPGGQLTIDLEPGGSIEISAWDRDLLGVEAEFHGPDADEIEFEVGGGGDRADVRASYRSGGSRQSAGGSVRIRLPRRFDVRLRTTGGDVRVENVEGRIEGETMGGQLQLSGLCGALDLTTYGGNVRLEDSDAEGSVRTYGGNIQLADVAGTVEARTLGGNVIYDDVRPGEGRCAGGSSDEEIKVSTQGGNIHVPQTPYGADLETMGGDITVDRGAGHVKAKTMGGNIEIGPVDGWIKATTMGGSIEAEIVGTGGEVRLTSYGGDITLTVPSGFSMDLDITLAYTKNSRRQYAIDSDFPLTLRRSDDWDYGEGSPRKYVYGTAPGGRYKVKIETINGDVRLRAAD